MTNDTKRRKLASDLREFTDTIEQIVKTYEAIEALPSMKLLREAVHASHHAPNVDPRSPAFAPFRRAGRYERELERLAALKPTRWEWPC